jgi:hypothetical protein
MAEGGNGGNEEGMHVLIDDCPQFSLPRSFIPASTHRLKRHERQAQRPSVEEGMENEVEGE